ncbi:GNAT family N-acetyltransferase [Streptomyces sp. NPDC058045]|uniref:GNAT family N-acetyltransferase n=1 Tax=Streptomyces sp. NPDC058045 TaxID=3346311 RepID=UPI0036E1EE63
MTTGIFALLASSAADFRSRWPRRPSPATDPRPGTGRRPPDPDPGDGEGTGDGRVAGATVLWRLRTTVCDAPGSLAALCSALAALRVDILSLGTHPLAEGTVDEFLLRAPAALTSDTLGRAVDTAGGRDTWTERADTHDLVDTATSVLGLATRAALDSAELPLALRKLLGRCTIGTRPAPVGPAEDLLDGTVLRLRTGDGGLLTVERPQLPFTPTEFARARALVELGRAVRISGTVAPRAAAVTVGRAGTGDLAEARAMHRRCSSATLRARYHGPVGDADRYLDHLLGPHFGRTLAARTGDGRIAALGHLLWDGAETEVALLVEDAWQRRGVGTELLARLVELAREAGSRSVYAVTRESNTAMAAAMRSLGLPLDYQLAEGTLVITAHLPNARSPRSGSSEATAR